MIDLYAQLITNINRAIDTIESGSESVGKAIHANTANTAKNAENVEAVPQADLVKKANNVAFADLVDETNAYSKKQVSVSDTAKSSFHSGKLEEGVYLAFFRRDTGSTHYYHGGVLVVKPGKESWCGLNSNHIYGTAMHYNDGNITHVTGSNGEPFVPPYNMYRTIYLYKIGTLEQEG